MKKTIFLSHFLSENSPGYGGASGVQIRHLSKILNGASSNSQEWTISNHIGTHIDLPAHFDEGGRRLNDFKSNDWLFDKPYLMTVNCVAGEILMPDDRFDIIPMDADLLIIKTGFQKFRGSDLYWQNNPGLSPELAQFLRSKRPNIQVVGFDFISITSYANRSLGRIAHKAFLGVEGQSTKPIRVIEDMKLDELFSHPKEIIVAPLLVDGADGAPVTVIASI